MKKARFKERYDGQTSFWGCRFTYKSLAKALRRGLSYSLFQDVDTKIRVEAAITKFAARGDTLIGSDR